MINPLNHHFLLLISTPQNPRRLAGSVGLTSLRRGKSAFYIVFSGEMVNLVVFMMFNEIPPGSSFLVYLLLPS
jgi:hypothetical protein